MPNDLSSYDDVVNRIRADVKSLLPGLDPTIFGSLIRAITDSNAGRHYDNILSLKQLEKQLFPTPDANTEILAIWAAYEGITPFTATTSSGFAVFTGSIGAIIDIESVAAAVNGNEYTSVASATVSENKISLLSLTRSGSTVTGTTQDDHGLATNIDADISGAVEVEYNGTQLITVLSPTTFSYEIAGAPATPATGTLFVTCICARLEFTSNEFGLSQNLESGAMLTLSETIAGVNDEGYVDANGFTGGFDAETSLELYGRIIQSRSNPVANFNVAAIEKEVRKIQGVTRLLIKRITPRIGAVTVLFVRDFDDNIIPDSSEVLQVKNQILTILQATSEEDDVVVLAPTPVVTDFTFGAIQPNTATMKDAIAANLKAFYEDEVTFETNIQEDKYRAAITGTIDPDTGDTLSLFNLNTPGGDIAVGLNSIGTLGNVVF